MKNPTLQAYEELQRAYDHYNCHLFNGALPFCLLTFQREKRAYGYFSSKRFIHRDEKMHRLSQQRVKSVVSKFYNKIITIFATMKS